MAIDIEITHCVNAFIAVELAQIKNRVGLSIHDYCDENVGEKERLDRKLDVVGQARILATSSRLRSVAASDFNGCQNCRLRRR